MQHRNSVLVNQSQPLQHQNTLFMSQAQPLQHQNPMYMSQAQPVRIHQPSHVEKKESSPCCKAVLTFLGMSCFCLFTIVGVLSILTLQPAEDDIAKYEAAVASLQQDAPSNSTSVDGLDDSSGGSTTLLGSNHGTTATLTSLVEGSRLSLKIEAR